MTVETVNSIKNLVSLLDSEGYAVWREFGTNLSDLELLASELGEQSDGVFESGVGYIEFIPDKELEGSIANSKSDMVLHTDGSFERCPPKYIVLQMLESDYHGFGSTQILTAKNLYLEASKVFCNPENYSFEFSREEHGKVSNTQSTIFHRDNSHEGVHIRFRQDSKYTINALDEHGYELINVIENLIKDGELVTNVCLNQGDVIFLNNHKVLHGRTQLSGKKRRIIRRLRLKEFQ